MRYNNGQPNRSPKKLGTYGSETDPYDEFGHARKSRWQYPYNYSTMTHWVCPGWYERISDSAVYDDRLQQWDYDKFNTLRDKWFKIPVSDNSKYGGWKKYTDVEALQGFLREYHDLQDLEVCEIIEGCNASSGYPWWAFTFRSATLRAIVENQTEDKMQNIAAQRL